MASDAVSSTQSNRSSSPAADRVSTIPEPPRQQAESRNLSERFSAQVEQAGEEGGRKSQEGHGGAERTGRSQSSKSDFDSLGGQSGQQKESELAQGDIARIIRSAEAKTAAANVPVHPADKTMLEKMAAQIAESWPLANSSSAEIEFPVGWLAQKAHLMRQPDGGMAIRIAGLDPKLNALRAGYAQMALLLGLDRRRLRIASLVFEKPERDYSGRASTIPKTV